MDPWIYETAEDLDRSIVERLRHFPRQPDMLVYGARLVAAATLRAWLAAYHRLRIVGRENLPGEGSFVLVANHASHLDTVCLLSALPLSRVHRAFPAAASDYFFVSVPRLAFAAVVVNALPFDRRIQIRQSLSLCRKLLANPGNVLIIFPEGTRSTTGRLGTFKPGIGMLVAGTNYPVVPCYLDGAYRALPRSAWFPRPRRIRLTIGRPLDFSHLSPGKAAAQQVCGGLRDAVVALGADSLRREGEAPAEPLSRSAPTERGSAAAAPCQSGASDTNRNQHEGPGKYPIGGGPP
jgi:1-acyl-sn-glycerol-3-phosphate acyltransferase